MRAGRDRVEESLTLDRVRATAPFEREFLVVEAARDVGGQYDRGVDGNRRARCARSRRLGENERKHDGRRNTPG